MKKFLPCLFMLLFGTTALPADEILRPDASPHAPRAETAPAEHIVTFRFIPAKDMFYIPWEGNGDELTRLYSLVDRYRDEITGGTMPVYVDGYCASMPTDRGSRYKAYIRASRVKSELIVNKGLLEQHFITWNYPAAYTDQYGEVHKEIVVVTLRLPSPPEPEPQPIVEEPPQPAPPAEVEPEPQPVIEPQPEPVVAEPVRVRRPCRFDIRTNLLYDAFLLPTLGIEWRVNRNIGIKLDGSRSWWGNTHGKVQKVWLVSPEVRWYLLDAKRLYVGASGNFGKYNIYKYLLGGMFSSDTGYQGKLWNAGATVGYQLPLSRALSLDFNLGVGYTRSEYDSFTLSEGVRRYKDRDRTKNFFGPTQAGVNLVWTIGRYE